MSPKCEISPVRQWRSSADLEASLKVYDCPNCGQLIIGGRVSCSNSECNWHVSTDHDYVFKDGHLIFSPDGHPQSEKQAQGFRSPQFEEYKPDTNPDQIVWCLSIALQEYLKRRFFSI